MNFERGPAEPSEMPMAPRVVTPGLFVGLASGLVPTLQGIDDALGGVVVIVAPFVDRELTTAYNGDVAPAAASVGSIDDPAEGQVIGEVSNALGWVAGNADVERRDLPGPDALEPDDALNQPIEPEPAANDNSGGGTQPPEA